MVPLKAHRRRARLVTEALPLKFVRLLLVLFDDVKDSQLQDSIYLSIKVTCDGSPAAPAHAKLDALAV